MTQLRDARLRRALDAAPDAQAQPPQATRDAVRAAAVQAVRKPRPLPWWKRLLSGLFGRVEERQRREGRAKLRRVELLMGLPPDERIRWWRRLEQRGALG